MVKWGLLGGWLLILLMACGGPDGRKPPPEPGPIDGNNAAILSGTSMGLGTANQAALRKEISLELQNPHADISLGKAYLARRSEVTDDFDWFVALTNTSDKAICLIQLSELEFQNDANEVLNPDQKEEATLIGNIGIREGSALFTPTCLDAGKSAYMLGVKVADESLRYAAVAKLLVAEVITGAEAYKSPLARIVPQSYQYAPDTQTLSVTMKNEGTEAAEVADFSFFYLLDNNEVPLYSGTFQAPDFIKQMNPGETRVLEARVDYEGTASKLKAIVAFNQPPAD